MILQAVLTIFLLSDKPIINGTVYLIDDGESMSQLLLGTLQKRSFQLFDYSSVISF